MNGQIIDEQIDQLCSNTFTNLDEISITLIVWSQISSVQNKLYALDAITGESNWSLKPGVILVLLPEW